METAVTEIDRDPPVTVLAIRGEVDAGAEGLERLSRLLDSLIAAGDSACYSRGGRCWR